MQTDNTCEDNNKESVEGNSPVTAENTEGQCNTGFEEGRKDEETAVCNHEKVFM